MLNQNEDLSLRLSEAQTEIKKTRDDLFAAYKHKRKSYAIDMDSNLKAMKSINQKTNQV